MMGMTPDERARRIWTEESKHTSIVQAIAAAIRAAEAIKDAERIAAVEEEREACVMVARNHREFIVANAIRKRGE